MGPFLAAVAVAANRLADPAQILAANQRATLLANTAARGALLFTYEVRDSGLDGHETRTVDLEHGWYAETSELGPLHGGGGFDGQTPWIRDLTGHHLPQRGGDRRQFAVNQAYRNTDGWWHSDRAGARIESLACDRLRVTPPGGMPFEAGFDPTTHLLNMVEEQSTFGNRVRIRYADYQARDNRMVPTRIEIVTNDDPASAVIKTLTSIESIAARPASSYAMPLRQPKDWSMAAPGRVKLPFRLINNHIIVDAQIDGQGPFPFLLDTGGHEIITPSTLAKLVARSLGGTLSGGAGESKGTAAFATVSRIDVGGAVLLRPNAVVTEFSPPDVEGLQLGGMLGVGFMSRFVVQIDYARRELTLIDPARFGPADRAAAGTPIPIDFYEHMPQIEGTIEGRAARLNIDTGSRSDVSITRPFVERAGLDAAHPDSPVVTDGWGAGGPTRAKVVRLGRMALGPFEVCGPLAGLSSARAGAFSDPNFDGNVGTGLLKHYRVTFDYRSRKMYLAPENRLDADTSAADRAGMWINASAGGLQVMDLLPGGPAAAAGLAKGDVIVSVDGKAWTERALSDWRTYFKLVPVELPVSIRYLRAGEAMVATLRPRDSVPPFRCR